MTAQQPDTQSEIINLLWNLKQRVNKSPHHPAVDFTKLVKDPDYRRTTLQAVQDSPDKQVRQLAHRLREAPWSDSLVGNNHPLTSPLRGMKPVLSRRWRWSLLVVLVVAFLIPTLYQGLPALQASLTGIVKVDRHIDQDTTWYADRVYQLTTDIFVHNNARLTLEPGTTVKGEHGSSLIVAQGSQLIAEGSRSQPIVFTSAQPFGSRKSGDWGGVVMLGRDRTNEAFTRVEGVDSRDIRGQFGGQVEDDGCGILRFVRIEYAGFEAFPNNELNGLTLGGCGPQTQIDYVQVHRALDDGIEMFGGSADLRHIVISGAKDDGLDWDLGWDGRVQFLIVQQHPNTGDNAFEGDNSPERDYARPRSMPAVSNVTLIGSDPRHNAMVLRTGTAGRFYNVLLAGYGSFPVDLRGNSTGERIAEGSLKFNALTVDSQVSQYGHWPKEAQDNDAGFDELDLFSEVTSFSTGLLADAAWDMNEPDFRMVSADSPPNVSFPDNSDFWDVDARFPGAVAPESATPWYLGWTDFSEG